MEVMFTLGRTDGIECGICRRWGWVDLADTWEGCNAVPCVGTWLRSGAQARAVTEEGTVRCRCVCRNAGLRCRPIPGTGPLTYAFEHRNPRRSRITSMTTNLFRPISIGSMSLPHRVAMAPLTRSRAG